MYGLPLTNNTMVMFYNQDLFNKFGVPYPRDGMTWEEAFALGERLTRKESNTIYLGLAVSQAHALRMNQFSLPFVDPQTDKPTIADPNWKKVFETYVLNPAQSPLYKEFIVQNQNKVPFQNEFIKTQNLAMFGMVANMMSDPTLSSVNWDVVSMPVWKEKPKIGMQAYPNYISVTSSSKQKDAAMAVIRYLVSDEVQKEKARSGVIPALKSEEIRKEFGQAQSYKNKNLLGALFTNSFAPIAPKTVYDADVEAAYRKNAVNVILNQMDLNTMFREAEEQAAAKIAEKKKQ
jgi:multiple sugar transport system substrate-binding protein